MQSTEYRPIENFPAYRVGSDGSVWSRWRKGPGADLSAPWRQLDPVLDREGYRRVELHGQNGERITRKLCGLVLASFGGPRQAGMECRHLDGDKQNDCAANLAWGTPLENHADKRRHGTIAKGARHGKTKLSESQISEILAAKGSASQQSIADKFGVSRGYVGQLWSGARKRVEA